MAESAEVLLLKRLPSGTAAYLRAAGTALRRAGEDARIPATSVRVNAVGFEPGRLEAYREICGFRAGALPITYPQVVAAPLHIHLMAQRGFPFPLLGLVHVANHIEQARPLDPQAEYDILVQPGEQRRVRAGIEFDLVTDYLAPGSDEPLWHAVTTIIHRMPPRNDLPRSSVPADRTDGRAARYIELEAPADIGRRYGRISGDMNPIHLSALSARLFGFPRAIAHGMWSLARCAAMLEPSLSGSPATLDVRFRKPLLLPGRAALRYIPDTDAIDFRLIGQPGGAVHLDGRLATRGSV